jgi:hypothetical protein
LKNKKITTLMLMTTSNPKGQMFSFVCFSIQMETPSSKGLTRTQAPC